MGFIPIKTYCDKGVHRGKHGYSLCVRYKFAHTFSKQPGYNFEKQQQQ